VASLSQGRTAAAQCGLFTHKSVPVIFEPPCILCWSQIIQRLFHCTLLTGWVCDKACVYCVLRTECLSKNHVYQCIMGHVAAKFLLACHASCCLLQTNSSAPLHNVHQRPEATKLYFKQLATLQGHTLKSAASGLYWFTQPCRYFHVHPICMTMQ